VEPVRAAANLLERALDRAGEVAGLDPRAETRRAGDVGALADHDEAGVGPDLERLEPAPACCRLSLRDVPWGQTPDTVRNRQGVLGRGAAAAAGHVQEAVDGKLAQEAARHLGRLVVAAEGVREARVRMRADEAR